MSHGEEWRFLHVDPSVVILYYCGRGNTWNYEGGLVLSRDRSSPAEHSAMAREVRLGGANFAFVYSLFFWKGCL
jgi:hypothetical protein